MVVIESDKTAYFDVDDTLVMWEGTPGKRNVNIKGKNINVWVQVNFGNLRQLVEHAERGHAVVVWSAGGYQWAKAVVKSLGIEKHVTAVLCKPVWAYDDLPPSRFMPKSKYIPLEKQP